MDKAGTKMITTYDGHSFMSLFFFHFLFYFGFFFNNTLTRPSLSVCLFVCVCVCEFVTPTEGVGENIMLLVDL